LYYTEIIESHHGGLILQQQEI